MATGNNTNSQQSVENLTLHEMFRVVGDQMTPRDVRVLKFLYTGILSDTLRSQINDGYTFLLALEKIGRVDNSNFKHILHVLRIITRHDLLQYVTLRKRKTVEVDPVDQYLEETAKTSLLLPSWSNSSKRQSQKTDCKADLYDHDSECSNGGQTDSAECGRHVVPAEAITSSTSASALAATPFTPEDITSAQKRPKKVTKRRRGCLGRRKKRRTSGGQADVSIESLDEEDTEGEGEQEEIRKKVTCDIRLRVRAEYCHHDNALEGIHSNKQELIERQFEKFMQANTILKSRDLGSIICDIKFSELTYLDAFWRDYINGSLLEALKGVFITESLKQAVGHEAIKLLVNVDEDDYEAGRLKLLQNLQD